MKINVQNETIETNLNNEGTFSFTANRHAFKILSDTLYTDKKAAIIRELACNCWDSHIQAGVTDKFIVTLPSLFSRVLSFEDFGTGMSEETIRNVYTAFFSSTKTTSNDVTGMFGLGSKTPFSYTDDFSVVSTFNGVRTTYLMFLKDGLPTFSIVDRKETTARNGVKVSISVESADISAFNRSAVKELSFFPEDVIDIRGEFKRIPWTQEGNLVTIGEMRYYDYNPLRGWYVKQGAVLYRLERGDHIPQNFNDIFSRTNETFIIDFPIGEIEVTPSRETISMTDYTKNNIRNALSAIADNFFEKLYNQHIEGKTVDASVVKVAHEIASKFNLLDRWSNISSALGDYAEKIAAVARTIFKFKAAYWYYNMRSRNYNALVRAKRTLENDFSATFSNNFFKIGLIVVDEKENAIQRISQYLNDNRAESGIVVDEKTLKEHNSFYRTNLTMQQYISIIVDATKVDVIKTSSMPAVQKVASIRTSEYRGSNDVYFYGADFSNGGPHKRTLTDEEIEDEFYYAWISRGTIFNNETEKSELNTDTIQNQEAFIRNEYKGKPVYYLTGINKKIVQYGTNIIPLIRQDIASCTAEDAMFVLNNRADDPMFAGVDFSKTANSELVKYNASYVKFLDECKKKLHDMIVLTDTQIIRMELNNQSYKYNGLGFDFSARHKAAMEKFLKKFEEEEAAEKVVDKAVEVDHNYALAA